MTHEKPDRQALQAAGIHPAPCARHCEANAFEIAARGMRKQITELQEALESGRKPWVGLTDEEKHQLNDTLNLHGRFPVIDAIEAKLKEKNT